MKKGALYFIIEFIFIGITGAIAAIGLHIEGVGVISYLAFWCAFACGIMLADIYSQERREKKKDDGF